MIRENYHTHTYLCRHAVGKIEDYIKEAIRHNFHSLGMSDHGPLENAGFKRMTIEEFFSVYLAEFKKCYDKYSDQINLYIGLEIEYVSGMNEYYEKLLKAVDYLILGPHYYSSKTLNIDTSIYNINTPQILEEYVTMIEEALSTKYFKILAHPDIFLLGYNKWDKNVEDAIRRICKACIDNNVMLECNANGYLKGIRDFGIFKDFAYPNSRFFKIVSEYKDIKVLVSSDAHSPKDLKKDMDITYSMLEDLGITPITYPFGKRR